MANQPWCKCGKDPTTKFHIPSRSEGVCWECFVRYCESITGWCGPYDNAYCMCHFEFSSRPSCEHCNGQYLEELQQRQLLASLYPPMPREPFDTKEWRINKGTLEKWFKKDVQKKS